MKNRNLFLVVVLFGVILVLVGILTFKIYKDKISFFEFYENNGKKIVGSDSKEEDGEVSNESVREKINIFNGNDRPIAVMIDNHSGAWPQAGLNKAYLVYEIVVEGGETRLMALFKGVSVDKIGPVRSSRHYFLDYAMENGAIYVHYGWSPQAEADIGTYRVQNINGITQSSSDFWRVKDKSSPHNVFTSTTKILEMAESKGYSVKSNDKSVFKYTANEARLENAISATQVTIPHSNLQTVEYVYDAQKKVYTRFARGKKQTDYETKEDLVTKNIIVEFVDNYTLEDPENKGRQGLNNVGTFDGYYVTDGKAMKIKCIKSSRMAKTVYKDLNGVELEINDGNTWVQICPKDAQVKF